MRSAICVICKYRGARRSCGIQRKPPRVNKHQPEAIAGRVREFKAPKACGFSLAVVDERSCLSLRNGGWDAGLRPLISYEKL